MTDARHKNRCLDGMTRHAGYTRAGYTAWCVGDDCLESGLVSRPQDEASVHSMHIWWRIFLSVSEEGEEEAGDDDAIFLSIPSSCAGLFSAHVPHAILYSTVESSDCFQLPSPHPFHPRLILHDSIFSFFFSPISLPDLLCSSVTTACPLLLIPLLSPFIPHPLS